MSRLSSLPLRMSPQGRIEIPDEFRRHLGLAPGEELVARVKDRQLVVERQADILERLRLRFARLPENVRLSDLAIAGRRRFDAGTPDEP